MSRARAKQNRRRQRIGAAIDGKRSTRLILASASKRRQKILRDMGISFRVMVPNVPELFLRRAPSRTAGENALRKGRWCSSRHPGAWVIAADTVVAFRGNCVTKPVHRREAGDFLAMFSGKAQTVYTGVYMRAPGCRPVVRVVRSRVLFKRLTPAVIARYLRHVDPMDKAGAYDIDQHGDLIIKSYTGSYSNIMGLPAETVATWLRGEGFIPC